MRICLLGPSYPFRNSLYTTLLCHHLRKRHEVHFLSYRRQYPAFLYPGRSQVMDDAPPALVEEAIPLLDPFNPLSWSHIVRTVQALEPDLLLLNWLTPFFAVPFAYITAGLHKCTDVKVVYICHNVRQHEPWPAERWLTRLALGKADALVVQSEEDARNANELFPTLPIALNHHPTYEVVSRPQIAQAEARRRLGLPPGKIVLFFGFIRKYKGLEYLIEALPLVAQSVPNVHLLIVGEFWEGKTEYCQRIRDLQVASRVTVIDEYIPDEMVHVYFACADIVVAPYVSATQSGIIQLAFGAMKPVIATNVGGLPEVVDDGATGFIVEPRDPRSLASAMAMALQDHVLEHLATHLPEAAQRFSWDHMVQTIESLPIF